MCQNLNFLALAEKKIQIDIWRRGVKKEEGGNDCWVCIGKKIIPSIYDFSATYCGPIQKDLNGCGVYVSYTYSLYEVYLEFPACLLLFCFVEMNGHWSGSKHSEAESKVIVVTR